MTTATSLLRRATVAGGLLLLAAACTPGVSPSPSPSPGANPVSMPRTGAAAPTPLVPAAWPVRTSEAVDLWLHSYALLSPDTMYVPYFERGYRDRISTTRRERNVSSQLDANRATLVARLAVNPALATSGQFLPLYFQSWEQMRQMIELFTRTDGNPNATNDPATRTYFAILGGAFPSAADREWLRTFTLSVEDERVRFYHDYWTEQQRMRASLLSHVDSLWQLQWRPLLQRFLNNSQQQNGEVLLSLPLGGEGRTVHFGKQENAVAVDFPNSRDDAEIALYVLAHEIAGGVASAAIADNTTPAEQRSGAAARYEQSAAVRAGAMLLERTKPDVVPGYMRYYLKEAGRTPPTDARAAFIGAFVIPDVVRDAIGRQLDVILGGI
jgi:hypothetical protein